ncbi:1,2-dihydroxy-3-keto-5-methylthiopentene dioxygenase [Jiangella endophytica]|uniref:1,2-dihydroxy-3-keto-5-methylthiopentene dioxygenase n=1 Tax=Jiangella endophytica TaxID=1623398 RepID=UPI0018E559A4|nr:cupin [Jiangella endophytica]
MSRLTVWNDTDPSAPALDTTDLAEITAELAALGARFARWELQDLPDDPTQDDVLEAYRSEVDDVIAKEGYTLVDVLRLDPSQDDYDEKAPAARQKFLQEHQHDDDEDRFFAAGSGIFYLHANGKVHAVFCEAGDLISVPADTTHWFDMGTSPAYVSVRFFHDEDGWVGDFTGSDISSRFPTYDQIAATPVGG